jgi:hypothetical protein
MGLTTGKKVTRALLRIERDFEEWQLTLKASDFAPGSLKTPKVETGPRDGEDPDALFLEKMSLVESCLELVDALFAAFLEVRLDDAPDGKGGGGGWREEVDRLREWMLA